ncbi:DUF6246 family protein [Yersinia kristensenii]|uniref:DUF6246 family protein n=1 Tax=Yersinia kristensenii TaxID=28152 RepID=UPI001562A66F|nr:DUF6246 family protein [Yersinia kristensenii]QKJ17466.1 hypothetical protein HRD70_21130 [Yersinia kristensenii]
MNPMVEIGEMLISDRDTDYFFRPSFTAMSRIGSPVDIVEAYATLNGAEASQMVALMKLAIEHVQRISPLQKLAYSNITGNDAGSDSWLFSSIRRMASKGLLSTAMSVIQACCDNDVSPLVGEWHPGKKGVIYRRGGMSTGEIILIAHTLIEHGVMGKAKIRKPQRAETNSYVNEFRAIEYINSARIHFVISREEAEQLTMTEFQLMLNAKYPDQKGFTREEYDTVRDDYFKRREARIAAEKAKKAA